MHIFVYSDESGVLDKEHNEYYVFGGLIFTSGEQLEETSRRYIAAERNIRLSESIDESIEVKACKIKPASKNKLYRCLANIERFGIVIEQQKLNDELFADKKSKQRYLDWAYKMAVKKKFEQMISDGSLDPQEVHAITFLVDEHSTATNGWYELRESLEREFKIGMWNYEYMMHHKPLFQNIDSIKLNYCNSEKKTLVRAADIVANHIYFHATQNNGKIPEEKKLHIYYHP